MSAALPTVTPMHNPWGTLRRLTAWTFYLAPLPAGVWGQTNHDARTITIRPGLTQAERRSTLAHELEHVRRGYRQGRCEEGECDQAAARRLIDLQSLGEALAWSRNLDEAAEELWVDRDLLDVRLDHLHPSERHYLRRRLADGDGVDGR